MPRTGTGTSTFIDVVDGVSGNSQATVNVYKAATSTPTSTDKPTGNTTYVFSTGVVTFTDAMSWSTTPPTPSAGQSVYFRIASAIGTGTSDVIADTEWSGAVQLGSQGVNGINSATVVLYARNTSGTTSPTDITTSSTYTFATGVLALDAAEVTWAQAIPAKGSNNYLWFITATAAATTATDAIAFSEWSTPRVLSEDGATGTSVFPATVYRRATATPVQTAPTGGSYDFSNNTLTAPTDWSATVPTGTDPLWSTSFRFSVSGATTSQTATTWSTPVIQTVNGDDGAQGSRGPGRFNRSITVSTAFPTVGEDDYRDDVLELVCQDTGGFWNDATDSPTTTGVCQISSTNTTAFEIGQPIAGDIAVITYTNSNLTPPTGTRGAIHDGSSISSATAWSTFAVQIDGSLLVAGTVVADSLTIGNTGNFYVDSSGNLTLTGMITIQDPPALVPADFHAVGRAVSFLGTQYICVERSGCLGTDLNSAQPGTGETVSGWQLFAGSDPAVTAFIGARDTSKTDYMMNELIYDDGQIYACDSATCSGADEPTIPASNWTSMVGGAIGASVNRMELDSSAIRVYSGIATALTVIAANAATSIAVTSTAGFPTSGTLILGGTDTLTYTGTTGTTFTGIPSTGGSSISQGPFAVGTEVLANIASGNARVLLGDLGSCSTNNAAHDSQSKCEAVGGIWTSP